MRSRLDGPRLFRLNGFFRWPDLEPLNPVLTVVSSLLSPLLRRLCVLRRSLPVLFLASEGPSLLAVFVLRASQLSSPAQKRVISAVRAAMDLGFSWQRWRASHSSQMLCLKASRASTPDSRQSSSF